MRLRDWDVYDLAEVDGEALPGQTVFRFMDGGAVVPHQYNVILDPSLVGKRVAATPVGGVFR